MLMTFAGIICLGTNIHTEAIMKKLSVILCQFVMIKHYKRNNSSGTHNGHWNAKNRNMVCRQAKRSLDFECVFNFSKNKYV